MSLISDPEAVANQTLEGNTEYKELVAREAELVAEFKDNVDRDRDLYNSDKARTDIDDRVRDDLVYKRNRITAEIKECRSRISFLGELEKGKAIMASPTPIIHTGDVLARFLTYGEKGVGEDEKNDCFFHSTQANVGSGNIAEMINNKAGSLYAMAGSPFGPVAGPSTADQITNEDVMGMFADVNKLAVGGISGLGTSVIVRETPDFRRAKGIHDGMVNVMRSDDADSNTSHSEDLVPIDFAQDGLSPTLEYYANIANQMPRSFTSKVSPQSYGWIDESTKEATISGQGDATTPDEMVFNKKDSHMARWNTGRVSPTFEYLFDIPWLTTSALFSMMFQRFERGLQRQVTEGDGTIVKADSRFYQMRGVKTDAEVVETATADTFVADDIYDFYNELDVAYAMRQAVGMPLRAPAGGGNRVAMNQSVENFVRKMKDTANGRYLWEPGYGGIVTGPGGRIDASGMAGLSGILGGKPYVINNLLDKNVTTTGQSIMLYYNPDYGLLRMHPLEATFVFADSATAGSGYYSLLSFRWYGFRAIGGFSSRSSDKCEAWKVLNVK